MRGVELPVVERVRWVEVDGVLAFLGAMTRVSLLSMDVNSFARAQDICDRDMSECAVREEECGVVEVGGSKVQGWVSKQRNAKRGAQE